MKTENLSTLRIHKLTQAQYDNALNNEELEQGSLYLTPEVLASTDTDGLMSSSDKVKLDAYAPNAIITHSSTTSLPNVVNGAILIAYDA